MFFFLFCILFCIFFFFWGGGGGFISDFLELPSVNPPKISEYHIRRGLNFKHEKSRVCTDSLFSDVCKFLSYTADENLVK